MITWKDELIGLWTECYPVGSRITCFPPPTDTDEDWLVKVPNLHEFINAARYLNFMPGGSWNPDDELNSMGFVSLRRASIDKVNLLVTESEEFVDKFLKATAMAKRLNLLEKDQRVALFQFVLYGRMPECSATGISLVPKAVTA